MSSVSSLLFNFHVTRHCRLREHGAIARRHRNGRSAARLGVLRVHVGAVREQRRATGAVAAKSRRWPGFRLTDTEYTGVPA
jgi:hypothetical protein